jgi:uncharacterized protein YjbI with pentapeptide repeats
MLRGLLDKLPQSKRALIEQVKTAANERALEAIARLQANGWTQDGSLHGVDFTGAQLSNVRLAKASLQNSILREADLTGAYFGAANLRSADLYTANLRGANLGDAHLHTANLVNANLQHAHLAKTALNGANLQQADLQNANLWCACLYGADLRNANLRGANLSDVLIDTQTFLPDGTHWTADADLTHFTDPTHLNFWMPAALIES